MQEAAPPQILKANANTFSLAITFFFSSLYVEGIRAVSPSEVSQQITGFIFLGFDIR